MKGLLCKWVKRVKILFRCYAVIIIVAVLLCVLVNKVVITGLEIYRVEFVLNSIITCAATFTGFILTSLSILIGFSTSDIMQEIEKNSGLFELRCRYITSLLLGIVVIVFCIFLGANIGEDRIVEKQWLIVGSGLIVSYLASIVLTGYYILAIIVRIPIKAFNDVDETPSAPTGKFRC